MQAARITIGDLAALGSRNDWVCEQVKEWPKPRTSDEYVLVWSGDPARPPVAIVVPTPIEEFYAWSTTYLAHLTPLSAVLRVMNQDEPRRRKVDPQIEPILGLLFSEATAWLAARGEEDSPRIEDFLASLSFALAQAACQEIPPSVDETAARWLEARDLLQLPRAPFRVEHVLEVWGVAVAGKAFPVSRSQDTSEGDLFAHAAKRRAAQPQSEDRSPILHPPDSPQLADLVEGPMEDRVRKFKDLVRQEYAQSNRDDARLGSLLGAALSKISGGTFRHTRLLAPGEVRDVRPLLWYGYFEATAAQASGSWFCGALGARLAQELQQRWSAERDASERDIDLEELRILRRGKHSISDIVAKRRDLVRVELQPGVVAEFANPSSRRRDRIAK